MTLIQAASQSPRIDPAAVVHPHAIIEGDVTIGPRTRIGPGCLLLGHVGPVVIGADCTLIAQTSVNGPITLGDHNTLYPGVCLGFAPQDVGFDPNTPGSGCVIGHRNVFREGATVHRGKTTLPTRIGDGNYWMTNTHLGHDGVVANNCIIGSGTVLGGHVEVADKVIIGGLAAMHQFARAGRGSFISGCSGVTNALPPWFICTSIDVAASVNLIGLRRSGASADDINTVRWIFKMLYRSDCTPQQAIPVLQERAGEPLVDEYINFVQSAKRGICHGSGRARRGHSPINVD